MGVKLNINPENGTVNPFDALASVTAQATAAAVSAADADADRIAAAASASAASGSASTASTQATAAATSAAAAASSAAAASGSASAAATSAANALTYKNAAQTAQTNAETAETGSEAAQTAAELAQAAAELARDSTYNLSTTYLDIASGRAAVADGQQFDVAAIGAIEVIRYRRDSSSTQTELNRFPTSKSINLPDVWRIKQKRAETARVGGLYSVVNQQQATKISLRSGTRNADGTITIPPNDYIMSEQWGALYSGGADAADPTKWWYLHVGVADLSGNEVYIDAKSRATDYNTVIGGGGLITGTVTTQTAPGCKEFALRNNTNTGGTAWGDNRYFIHNQTGTPITIYPPIYTTDNIDHPPEFITGVDREPVEPLPVRDRDWTKLFTSNRAANFRASKAVTKASDSVNGLSGNAGTLYAPKATLAQMGAFATGDVVGLYRSSTWRETIQLYPSSLPGIEIIDVCFGALGRLPKLSAFKAVPDGDWVDNLTARIAILGPPMILSLTQMFSEHFTMRSILFGSTRRLTPPTIRSHGRSAR